VNPALGIRLGADVIVDERAAMDPVTFGRERLGMWDEDGANAVIPASVWASCADESSEITTTPRFALDVSPARTWAAISVSGKRPDGLTHVEVTSSTTRDGLVTDHRPGVEWVVPRAAELAARWMNFKLHIIKGSAAESLVPALDEAGVTVELVSSSDATAACGLFYDLATAGSLRHLGQPVLTVAVSAAVSVDVGDGAWKFARRKSASDITPLYSCVVAAWAANHSSVVPMAW
jgi:hypothetical protein